MKNLHPKSPTPQLEEVDNSLILEARHGIDEKMVSTERHIEDRKSVQSFDPPNSGKQMKEYFADADLGLSMDGLKKINTNAFGDQDFNKYQESSESEAGQGEGMADAQKPVNQGISV